MEKQVHENIESKLDLILSKLESFEAKSKMIDDLIEVSLPIASEAAVAVNHLAAETVDKGYMHFAKVLLKTAESTIPRWTEQEMNRLGEHISSVIMALMEMSNPETLKTLEKAGMMKVMRNLSRREVKEGLAFLTHFLYLAHPGRGNEAYGEGLNLEKSAEYTR